MASRSWKAPASKVRRQCSGCAPFFSLLMNGPSRWAPAQTVTRSCDPPSPHQGPRHLRVYAGVYAAPPELLPLFCSKAQGSGESELSAAENAALATGQHLTPPAPRHCHCHCHHSVGPKGLGWGVYDSTGHGKGQAPAEGESGRGPSFAAPLSGQFQLPPALSPQRAVNETSDQSGQRGTKPLTQDACSVGTTISDPDLRENLEKGVCQTQPPACQKEPRPRARRALGLGPWDQPSSPQGTRQHKARRAELAWEHGWRRGLKAEGESSEG